MSRFARTGAAFAAGAPLGASWGIAGSVEDDKSATAAAKVATPQAASPFSPGSVPSSQSGFQAEKVRQESIPSADGPSTLERVFGALNAPVDAVGNYVEGTMRNASRLGYRWGTGERSGGLFASTLALGSPFQAAGGDWRKDFDTARDSESSVAQTAWSLLNTGVRKNLGPDGVEVPILDDPEKRGERAEYFGSGSAKWVTGTADAAFNIFADPLVYATAGGSKLVQAGRKIGAVDVKVAANASRVERGASATKQAGGVLSAAGRENVKASRFQSAIEGVTDRYYDTLSKPGGLAAVAKDPVLSQTADAGSVAYMLRRAKELGTDVDDSKRLMDEVLYAGAGDRKALASLSSRSNELSVELEQMLAPNLDTAVAGVLTRTGISHGDALRALDDDTLIRKQLDAQRDTIKDELANIQRVMDQGTGGLGVGGVTGDVVKGMSAGGINQLPSVSRRVAADVNQFARVHRTIGRVGLAPVHLVGGRRIPQVMNLSADDAVEGFEAAAKRVEGMLVKSGDRAALGKLDTFRDRFMSARSAAEPGLSRTQRHDVLREFNKFSEDYLVAKHAVRKGRDARELRGFIREVTTRRTAEMERLGLSAKQALDAGEAATLRGDDGVYALTDELARSVATSQFQDVVSVVDWKQIDHALSTKFGPGVMRATDGAWRLTEAGLGTFNDLWKFAALLRPVGYPVRVQVDTQARALAHIGVMTHGLTAMRGMGNLARNLGRVDAAEVELFQKKMYAHARLQELDETGASLTGKRARKAAADRAEQERIIDMPLDVYKATEATAWGKVRRGSTDLKRIQGMSATLRKNGEFVPPSIRDTYIGGRESFTRVHEMDAHASILGLMDTQRSLLTRNLRRTGRYDLVDSSQPGWQDAYLDAVNRHVRNDHVLKSIAGGADDRDLLDWMRNTPQGREYWAAFATSKDGSAKWLSEGDLLAAQRQHVDALLPTAEIRNRAVLGNLRADDVHLAFPEGAVKPAVPHNLKETIDQGNPLVAGFNKTRQQYFRMVAEIPETVMGRHPFYKDAFSRRFDDLVSQSGRGESTLLRSEVGKLRNRADQLARRDVARIMFDTSKQTNLGYHMRFLMPFYAAWEDTMVKWARIMGENWETVPLMAKAFQAPNKMFEVTNEDGNRILPNGDVVEVNEDGSLGKVVGHEGDPTTGYIHIPLPKSMESWAGASDVRISKGSLNVIFQGEPFWLPGPGPVLSIPANEALVSVFPSSWTESTVGKWLLPYGTDSDSPLAQAAPMWARNAAVALKPEGERYMQTYAQLLAEEMSNQEQGTSPRLSQADTKKLVQNRARNWWILKAMGSQAPFSTQPGSALSWYREEWNRYITEYGKDAESKFMTDYPDYFDMTISTSFNETGVRASDDAMDEVKKYRGLVANYPKYGWAFAGASNLGGEFSKGAYEQQKRQAIGPGTDKKWRTTQNPNDAYNDVRVSRGWEDWNKFQTMLNLQLEDAGEKAGLGKPMSLRSKGAEGLREVKAEALSQMKQENPQWAAAYESSFGGDEAVKFLSAMNTSASENKGLASRSDMQYLAGYTQLREGMRQRMATLGISSLDSAAAHEAGLDVLWDEIGQGLASEDVGFEQMWNRVLQGDDLSAEVVIG